LKRESGRRGAGAGFLGALGSGAGAIARDVPFRSTGVASPPLGLGAVFRDVTSARAVVALGAAASNTIASQVAYTTASVASLASSASSKTTAKTTATAKTASTSISVAAAAAAAGVLRARTGDMADLATTIALGIRASAAATTAASCVRAVAGDVTFLVTFIACLGLGLCGTLTRDVTFGTTVVACWSSSLGAACSLVTEAATVITTSSAHGSN